MPDTSPTQPTGLRARVRALVLELGKFGTVGGFAFALDTLILNLLLHNGSEPLAAKTISTVLATSVAFFGNRYWTWRHQTHSHMARQYTMFFLLNAIGLGIALGCLAISHYGLGQIWPVLRGQVADNISGQLIGTAAGTIFRFWSYRRFVFRATAEVTPPPSPPATTVTSPSSPVGDSA